MRIDIISATPELLESPLNYSIIKRAKEKGIVEIYIHNLREYGLGNYKQIDDTQFGGGAGMVLMIEPISKCIEALKNQRSYDENHIHDSRRKNIDSIDVQFAFSKRKYFNSCRTLQRSRSTSS